MILLDPSYISISVTEVYDLMEKYNCKIVRSLKLKVEHCLLARPGVKQADIKEVVAHEQALNQCGDFLKSSGVKVHIDTHRRPRLDVLEFEDQAIGTRAIEIRCIHVKHDGGVLVVLPSIKYNHLLFIIRIKGHLNANIRRGICGARSFGWMELPRIVLLPRIAIISSIRCSLIHLHT